MARQHTVKLPSEVCFIDGSGGNEKCVKIIHLLTRNCPNKEGHISMPWHFFELNKDCGSDRQRPLSCIVCN